MRKIISILIIVAAAICFTGCIQPQVKEYHAVTVEAKHFFPKRVETTSIFYPKRVENIPILRLFNYKEEILPDRYVVEFYDESDSTYHFVRVCKFFWDRVEPGDTVYYNDTTRILKFSE